MPQERETPSYGVTARTILKSLEDAYVEEIERKGFTLMIDVFSSERMTEASEKIDNLYDAQKEAIGGIEMLRAAKDENSIRCPLAYDDFFLSLATHPDILAVVSGLLGKASVLTQQNAIVSRSDGPQSQGQWHRDMAYQHWTSSRPIALNFLVAVDRFFADGGATWVLPGSQHSEKFPSDPYIKKHALCLEVPAGSVIVMNAMTYHRAGVNRTPGYVRRGLNHMVGIPYLAQQIDIPGLLARRGADYSKDEFLSGYLGYRWNPVADVEAWRRKHMS